MKNTPVLILIVILILGVVLAFKILISSTQKERDYAKQMYHLCIDSGQSQYNCMEDYEKRINPKGGWM